jgi:mRNA interferase RelE/StbE
MSYRVELSAAGRRAFDALDKSVQRRLQPRIDALGENPWPPGCVKLAGFENVWRVRAGDWRIVYAIDDRGRLVIIDMVGHRREVYRGY